MTGISNNHRLIKVYFNSKSINDREAKAYLTATGKELLFIDLSETTVTPRQWAEILDGLNLHPSEIVDKNHQILRNEKGSTVELEKDEWLTLFAKSPEIIEGVIILEGRDVKYFKSPKDLIQNVVGRPDSKNDTRE